jgi:class 3 adenylate cyclase
VAEDTRAIDPAEPQLLTFWTADMRGFTAFSELNGDAAAAALVEQFARTVGIGVSQCGGRMVEPRGDKALAAFFSARAAMRAAVEVQAACRRPVVAGRLRVYVAPQTGHRTRMLRRVSGLRLPKLVEPPSVWHAFQVVITGGGEGQARSCGEILDR